MRYCYRIVLGFDPEDSISLSQMRIFDICITFMDECSCDQALLRESMMPLHEKLPHSMWIGTPTVYGWWFHYLLDKAPGWWNNFGQSHVRFSDVAGFAIKLEASEMSDQTDFVTMLAYGFANKGWSQGMYFMLGGRESANNKVATVVGSGDYQICATKFPPCDEQFDRLVASLAESLTGISDNASTTWLGWMALWYTPWRANAGSRDAPWDWGVPTNYTIDTYPLLIAALKSSSGTSADQVLYHTELGDNPSDTSLKSSAFVLSLTQSWYLCNGHSCVIDD